MLVRLQGALDRDDLVEKMVLLPGPEATSVDSAKSTEINLVVAYDGSPISQTALDLTLWIAHQTRLVTRKQVTVQAIYVIDSHQQSSGSELLNPNTIVDRDRSGIESSQAKSFEQADRILWQARCLAEEWRGSLKTHLRFGSVAKELRWVVEAEAAAVLLLGCDSVNHPLVQKLGSDFPCPVLGIPTRVNPNQSPKPIEPDAREVAGVGLGS